MACSRRTSYPSTLEPAVTTHSWPETAATKAYVRRTGGAGSTSTAASSTAAPLDQAETAAARARLAETLIGRQALLIVGTNEEVARAAIRGAKWGYLGWL